MQDKVSSSVPTNPTESGLSSVAHYSWYILAVKFGVTEVNICYDIALHVYKTSCRLLKNSFLMRGKFHYERYILREVISTGLGGTLISQSEYLLINTILIY